MTFDKETQRIRQCDGKTRHETFAAAMKHLKIGKRKHRRRTMAPKLGAYPCDFCGGFHIGHKMGPPPL